MDKNFLFISGLPRSGSTLLAGILRQNPNIHAGMSSPVAILVSKIILAMGAQNEYVSFIDDTQREYIVRDIVKAYYKDNQKSIIFDTNRMWCSKLGVIGKIFPRSKVVVCVRDSAWILDSFERVIRRNPLFMSKMFPVDAAGNVFSRIEHLASPTGTLGFAWAAIRDAYYGEYADRLVFVDYEALTKEPIRTMQHLYNTLGIESFQHDFDNVVYDEAGEFDNNLGAPGLHDIGRKVQFVQRQTVLPPELFEKFSNRTFWAKTQLNRNKVNVILPGRGAQAK